MPTSFGFLNQLTQGLDLGQPSRELCGPDRLSRGWRMSFGSALRCSRRHGGCPRL